MNRYSTGYRVQRAAVVAPFPVDPWSDPRYWHPVIRNADEVIIGYVGGGTYGVWYGRDAHGGHVWEEAGADRTRASMVRAIVAEAGYPR